jgi:hypothetical protein
MLLHCGFKLLNDHHWIGKRSFLDQLVTGQPNGIHYKGSMKLESPTSLGDIKLSMGENDSQYPV